ncbi:pyruvate kinase, partial [Halomonas sp. SIMBA_159]
EESGRPIAVMADLQGPKLRIGALETGSITLSPGDRLRPDLDDAPGDQGRVQLPHPEIFEAIEPGHTLLLDDGRVRLEVEKCG